MKPVPCVVAIFLFAAGLCRAGEDWPVFRGSPALTGTATGSLDLPLELLWEMRTGEAVRASAVVRDGTVLIGSTDGSLYAVEIENGRRLWTYDAGDAIEAPALVVDTLTVVGSLDGRLHAVRTVDGKRTWSVKAEDRIMGAPNAGTLEDGTIVIVFGAYDNTLRCVHVDGTQRWSFTADSFINGSPAVAGDSVIFAGCDARLSMLSLDDGSLLAQVEVGSYVAASVAVRDRQAYLGHYGGYLMAIDLDEERIVWSYGAGREPFFSSPAVTDALVLAGCRDGRLHAVKRVDGSRAWTVTTGGDVDSSPVVCDGTVVFGSRDGRLYVVSLADGKSLWSYDLGSAITGSPAVTGGRIVIGAEDGGVYAFGSRRRSGEGAQEAP